MGNSPLTLMGMQPDPMCTTDCSIHHGVMEKIGGHFEYLRSFLLGFDNQPKCMQQCFLKANEKVNASDGEHSF